MAEPEKYFLSHEMLARSSYHLARKVLESDFHPDLVAPLGRGGQLVGVYLHEFLRMKKLKPHYHPLGVRRYDDQDNPTENVIISGLDDKVMYPNSERTKVLLVDDVWDEGITIEKVLKSWRDRVIDAMPEVRVAVLFYKPTHNKTSRQPNYFVEETARWIVFPHELKELTDEEIRFHRGEEVLRLLQGEGDSE